jgi:hypothetical protein
VTRCKHPNASITEEFVTATEHYIINGVYDTSVSEPYMGDEGYTGIIEVTCRDCDVSWRGSRYVTAKGLRRVPKWVQDYAEQSGIPFRVKRRSFGSSMKDTRRAK